MQLSKADKANFIKAQLVANEHTSGGSYDVVALWVKGSRHCFGANSLHRLASSFSNIYPEICGIHAELDLFRRHGEFGGGTVFVAGKRRNSLSKMTTTTPCLYCATILDQAGVRSVVHVNEGILYKTAIRDLEGL